MSDGTSYADASDELRALCDFHAHELSTPDGCVFVELPTILYYSRADVTERAPGVLFIHGGGWVSGTPAGHIKHCRELAARGWVAATLRYTLWPDANIPQQLDESKAAVRWMRDNAFSLGLDPDRIAVAGGSAGGQLAAMVALDPADAIRAAVLWYPGVDLVEGAHPDLHAQVRMMCGKRPVEEMSPIHHVHTDAPPFLTMTGEIDQLTPVDMMRRFHARLTEAGVANELDVLAGSDHAYDLWPNEWPASFDRMAGFLAKYV